MNSIQVKNLVKKFGDFTAVDSVSFEVKQAEIFGLLGPNGAGKTTTTKMLNTILTPTSGEATVAGYDIFKQADKVRESIGVVFQESALDNQLTGKENLDFHGRLYGLNKKTRQERIEKVLKLVELEESANTLVKKYSGGMERRLEIARGFIHYPEVLFLDEPTLGLDTQSRRKIWKHIEKLRQEKKITIILTTHYMEEADELCDRVAIIDSGKIIANDKPSQLKSLLGEDIILLQITPQQKAIEVFKSLSWIKEVTSYNENRLQLKVKQAEQKLPSLLETAQKEKLEIHSINLRRPTLEDVFLNFTGKRIRSNS